jgi:hypothetical protein
VKRKSVNTTLRIDLYSEIQKLALKVSARKETKINANDLIEEGMELVIAKYKKQNNKPQ